MTNTAEKLLRLNRLNTQFAMNFEHLRNPEADREIEEYSMEQFKEDLEKLKDMSDEKKGILT
jgi:hypothetical protein